MGMYHEWWKEICACRILVGKSERKVALRRSRRRSVDIVEGHLTGII
jgi:hypothetical protein